MTTTKKQSKTKKVESVFMSVPELQHKCDYVMRAFLLNETLADELLEIKSFLIATRDGHRHKDTIGAAILKLSKIVTKLNAMKGIGHESVQDCELGQGL